jgi:hypothetical protein
MVITIALFVWYTDKLTPTRHCEERSNPQYANRLVRFITCPKEIALLLNDA